VKNHPFDWAAFLSTPHNLEAWELATRQARPSYKPCLENFSCSPLDKCWAACSKAKAIEGRA